MKPKDQKEFIDKVTEFKDFFMEFNYQKLRTLTDDQMDIMEFLLESAIERVQSYNFEIAKQLNQKIAKFF